MSSSNRMSRWRRNRFVQGGFSLIELMVALVIGLFLVAGAITVYLQSGNAYRTSDKVARLQEVGRYALDVIEPDIRLAGYWGDTLFMSSSGGSNINNAVADALITPNCGVNWIGDAANYIDGRDNGAALSGTCSASNTSSDALIIRRAAVGVAAVDTNKIQVQSTRTEAEIFSGSTVPTDFDPAASITNNLVVHAYYVVQTSTGGPYVLRRRTLAGSSGAFTFNEEDVISGIQDFQVQFGVDTDNDNNADQYVDPGATGGRRIVSVRIWLLVVSDDVDANFSDSTAYAYANRSYSAFNDNRRRVLMTKTIQIRNARQI